MDGIQGAEITLFNYVDHHGLDFPLNLVEINKRVFSEKFPEWIKQNLHIFAAFCKVAHMKKKIGHPHYGAKAIIEHIRQETPCAERPAGEFKINNDFTADLSRLSMIAYPDLNGFFKIKQRSV